MKQINDILWQSDDKSRYYRVVPADDNCFAICDRDECIEHCAKIIGKYSMFKKITKEEAEKRMGKKKFIVRFVNHDENELVEATCSAHAAILAQSRRIGMGENDVTVKSVEPINPYIVTVDKYTITNDNGILSVTRNGEFWDRSLAGDGLVLALVQRIEELETAADKKNKGLENLLAEMKKDIHDLASSDTVTRLRELMGLKR